MNTNLLILFGIVLSVGFISIAIVIISFFDNRAEIFDQYKEIEIKKLDDKKELIECRIELVLHKDFEKALNEMTKEAMEIVKQAVKKADIIK